MPRTVALLLAVLLTFSATAASKRRAVRTPPSFDESTVAGWLGAHAHPLVSAELQPYSYDLDALRTMIGDADVVGLGEGTHGTHEFHSVKLRVVDFLTRELGFDVVALEAPFPICNRLNAYVLGGAGDPKQTLSGMWDLFYPFWDDQELLALVEWMRETNANRGARPPVQIAGMDVLEEVVASNEVVNYLRGVDPPAAVQAEADYECIRIHAAGPDCYAVAERVRDALASRETELAARSSAAAFHDALQHARVVVQSRFSYGTERDQALAANALWIREHRGATSRIILWAHNEHVSKSESEWGGSNPMGSALAATLGNEYFAIATLTGSGTFHQWSFLPAAGTFTTLTMTSTFPPAATNSYEHYFHQAPTPAFFLSLRGTLPTWLTTPARYNAGTTNVSTTNSLTGSLSEKFDAAIYIDRTTPTTPLNH